jgi:hypothetical protein
MDRASEHRVVDAERMGGNLLIFFESGECALYPANLLHSILPEATTLDESGASEMDFDSTS